MPAHAAELHTGTRLLHTKYSHPAHSCALFWLLAQPQRHRNQG